MDGWGRVVPNIYKSLFLWHIWEFTVKSLLVPQIFLFRGMGGGFTSLGQLSQILLFLGRASLPLNIVVAFLLASDNDPVLIILSLLLLNSVASPW